jgi:hypothetical protein
VIDWYDGTAADLERTIDADRADEFALKRWAAHGYQATWRSATPGPGPGSAGGTSPTWNSKLPGSSVPHRRRGRAAGRGASPSGRLGLDAAAGYRGVRQTAAYRGDLHVLVEAPDGTMASSTIMWLDRANKTAEFEPVGHIRTTGAGGWQGRCFCTGCTWRGRPGPLT